MKNYDEMNTTMMYESTTQMEEGNNGAMLNCSYTKAA